MADYSDQTDIVAKVQPMLEELGNADPASLMPPETIAYIEIGSPGRQIETILNMLKGTPVEEALAGLNQGDGNQGGPAAMIQRASESRHDRRMKKIRGIGLGCHGTGPEQSAGHIVLFPGKNNALAALLHMGLSSLGEAADPVEGMNVVKFGDGGGAAYDDTVVIVTTPSPRGTEMLQQAIQRYKGKSEPAFAGLGQQVLHEHQQAGPPAERRDACGSMSMRPMDGS